MHDYQDQVRERVAELTGRDLDELDGASLLQQDLGFDSLKIMSLWQAVFTLLPDGSAASLNDFSSIVTLDDLVVAINDLGNRSETVAALPDYVSTEDPGGSPLEMPFAQAFFLVAHQATDSTSLCTMIEVDAPLDRARLHRARQALVERHVNLRTVFYIPPDAVQLHEVEYRHLDAPVAPAPEYVDLSEEADAPAALDALFHAQLNRKWDLRQWPLHDVIAVQLPAGRSALIIANEHIVSDGLGNQRLLADLLALYDDADAPLPLTPDLDAYRGAVARMNAWRDPQSETDFTAAEERTRNLPGLWRPGGNPTAPPMFRNFALRFDEATTEALSLAADAAGASLYGLLLASANRCLRERLALRGDPRSNLVQCPTAGTLYPDVDLGAAIGCFAQNLSLVVADDAGDLLHNAVDITRDLRDALINGHDRVQARLLAEARDADFPISAGRLPAYILEQARQGVRANLYMPFTGETGLPDSLAGASLTGYRAATRNVAGTIDILHEIHNGALVAFVNYDAHCFDAKDVEAFAGAHAATLEALATTPAQSAADPTLGPARESAPAIRRHDDLDAVLARIAAGIITHPATAIDPEADLEKVLGLDSLGRIRLVNAVIGHWQCRDRAKRLVGCNTLREMATIIAEVIVPAGSVLTNEPIMPPVAERPSGSSADPATPAAAAGTDPALPPIPLRHIEAQMVSRPDATAVRDRDGVLTYAALDAQSRRLASTLIARGVAPGDRVAVTARRGTDMLVAILGILRAGGTYVPLDPAFPADRMSWIIDHAGCRVWVAHLDILETHFAETPLPESVTHLVGLGAARPQWGQAGQIARADWSIREDPTDIAISPDDLMALLYTSGSTGHPKGVACHHRGYANRIDWHQKQFRLLPGERVAQKTSVSFDVSVWELFWPLMVGGTICAAERDVVTNPWLLAEWLAEERIAVMHFVPSLFTEFVNAACQEKLSLPDLRWLVFSGEALPVKPVRQWMTIQGTGAGLANLYGPTEASIDVTCEVIAGVPDPDATRIPIGSAIQNVTMLILDEADRLVHDAGRTGELCIAGVQLAHGYYRDAEKTAAAFIANHLSDEGIPGNRIYRTGDLAQWMPCGRIDYLGRRDSQIKRRGFRIELGEIEAVIANHPEIETAGAILVEAQGEGQDRLEVHVAPANTDARQVIAWAARHLPYYAVPDAIVSHAALPRNQNGKLDRKALRSSRPAIVTQTPPGTPGMIAADEASAVEARTGNGESAARVEAQIMEAHVESEAPPPQRAMMHQAGGTGCGASVLVFDYDAPLDPDALVRACNELIACHPALRSTFHDSDGIRLRRTRMRCPPLEPVWYDARGMADEAFRAAFDTAARDAALALAPAQWPLMDILVARRDTDRFTIAVIAAAQIADMVGTLTFSRGLLQHQDSGDGNRADPAASVPATASPVLADSMELYREASRRMQPEQAELESWWRDHLEPRADIATLRPDHPDGANTLATEAIAQAGLDRQALLAISAGASGDPGLHDLVAACLYLETARYHNGESHAARRVAIAHRLNGRNVLDDRLFFGSVDGFAYNVPLQLQLPERAALPETARAFRAAMKTLPYKGYSYDWLGDTLPARHWPAGRVSGLRLNFLGEVGAGQGATLRYRPESSRGRVGPPGTPRSCAVEILAQATPDGLVLRAAYSHAQYRKGTITDFLGAMITRLRAFAENTDSRNQEGLTDAA
ncbi:MAG: amino acid adenylation domain-containing protein [Salinarimonas sp.]|nr:amino acid adenylation domain-containing protein [Salinarimonas sp.]